MKMKKIIVLIVLIPLLALGAGYFGISWEDFLGLKSDIDPEEAGLSATDQVNCDIEKLATTIRSREGYKRLSHYSVVNQGGGTSVWMLAIPQIAGNLGVIVDNDTGNVLDMDQYVDIHSYITGERFCYETISPSYDDIRILQYGDRFVIYGGKIRARVIHEGKYRNFGISRPESLADAGIAALGTLDESEIGEEGVLIDKGHEVIALADTGVKFECTRYATRSIPSILEDPGWGVTYEQKSILRFYCKGLTINSDNLTTVIANLIAANRVINPHAYDLEMCEDEYWQTYGFPGYSDGNEVLTVGGYSWIYLVPTDEEWARSKLPFTLVWHGVAPYFGYKVTIDSTDQTRTVTDVVDQVWTLDYLNGEYKWVYTRYDPVSGLESPPSWEGTTWHDVCTTGVDLEGFDDTTNNDDDYTQFKIYRKKKGWNDYYYVKSIDKTTTSTVDSLGDATIQDQGTCPYWYSSIGGFKYAEVWRDRLWYAGYDTHSSGTLSIDYQATTATISNDEFDNWMNGKLIDFGLAAAKVQIDQVLTTATARMADECTEAISGRIYTIKGVTGRVYFTGALRNLKETNAPFYYMDCIPERGGEITGLCAQEDGLLVFKQRGIIRIIGQQFADATDYSVVMSENYMTVKEVDTPFGCISDRTICRDGRGGIYFFSGSPGIARYESGMVQIISEGMINEYIQTLDESRFDEAVGIYDLRKKRYYLGNLYSDATETDGKLWIVYDEITREFWVYDYLHARAFFRAQYNKRSTDITKHQTYTFGDWITVFGDDRGFLGAFEGVYSDGLAATGTISSATTATLTDTTSPLFEDSGEGLRGLYVRSNDEVHRIDGNDTNTLNLDDDWTTIPASGDAYYIGTIEWNRKGATVTGPGRGGFTPGKAVVDAEMGDNSVMQIRLYMSGYARDVPAAYNYYRSILSAELARDYVLLPLSVRSQKGRFEVWGWNYNSYTQINRINIEAYGYSY